MQPMRFHSHHGKNVHIADDGLIATRTCSFAHGICFGNRPLNQGEIFLVEIMNNERGWSGNLRIGLTQHNPDSLFELPQYALPDLVTLLGKSWVMAITKTQRYLFRDSEDHGLDTPIVDQEDDTRPERLLGHGDWIRTRCGTVRRDQLLPQSKRSPELFHESPALNRNNQSNISERLNAESASSHPSSPILPTEVGSRIGMIFTSNGKKGELYIILNGDEYGPMAADIPLSDGPLWPVIDVYGTTKQVQIIHLTISETLKTLCREQVLKHITTNEHLDALPLPKHLIRFLRYES